MNSHLDHDATAVSVIWGHWLLSGFAARPFFLVARGSLRPAARPVKARRVIDRLVLLGPEWHVLRSGFDLVDRSFRQPLERADHRPITLVSTTSVPLFRRHQGPRPHESPPLSPSATITLISENVSRALAIARDVVEPRHSTGRRTCHRCDAPSLTAQIATSYRRGEHRRGIHQEDRPRSLT